jgi:glucokinase
MASERFAVGVDLGGTNIKVGICSETGKIIRKTTLESRGSEGPDAVISQINKGIKQVLKEAKKNVTGIGIGSPGSVITKKGTVENPPNFPGWEKVPLGMIVKKEFDLKVTVENDANAAAVGEMIFGAGKKLKSFIMVTLGTGVGGGIIVDRTLFRGDSGAAGELGHITIDHNGKKCNCGSLGCIEAYAGNRYLVASVENELSGRKDSLLYRWTQNEGMELTPKLISEAAELNDEYAKFIITDLAQKLGHGLASVVNILDIANIIMGGGVAGFGKLLFSNCENAIRERVMIPLKEKIKLRPAKLKNEAGIKGASALVFY